MAIYITGSLAYDRIMNFPGKFSESILADHLHILNVSFFIDKLDENFGGNAGNIAYSLHLLGEKPVIVATAGKDFERYRQTLSFYELPLHAIREIPEMLTASAYIITDQANNQITAFHAAALMEPSDYTFPELNAATDMALIGPANPGDMIDHPRLYKEKGVRYIFDPAQQLPILAGADLRECIDGAYLLIGNDYEISLISEKTGCSLEALVAMTRRGVIITYGEEGSKVLEKGQEPVSIPALPIAGVVDPTGAGDAYRSGLIRGLVANLPLPVCARLGATCAAYCIEHKGPQEHSYTPAAFKARYEATFGRGSFPLN